MMRAGQRHPHYDRLSFQWTPKHGRSGTRQGCQRIRHREKPAVGILSGAGGKQYYRWWSISGAYKLAPGSTTLTVQVSDLSQWLSVFGERADASADATAGFWQAMNNLGAVGFSFGGGCFYGHGVRASDGGARFVVTNYAVW